jgi:hypothetical protein
MRNFSMLFGDPIGLTACKLSASLLLLLLVLLLACSVCR